MIGFNYRMVDMLQVECEGIEGARDKALRKSMDQATLVQKVDSVILQINHYPMDK